MEEKKNNVVDLALARLNRRPVIREVSTPTPTLRGITLADILTAFPGAKIIAVSRPLTCKQCTGDHVPKWRRGGKIVEVVLPDGQRRRRCHYCGREA